MHRASWILISCVAVAALAACDGDKSASGDTATPDTATATATTAAPSSTASATAAPEESASAAPDTSAAPDASAPTAKTGSATAPAASSAASGKKKYDGGSKGQTGCPMQGGMKGVMARAMASGDGGKIAKALNTIAAKPVAGYGSWAGIAAGGAAKAAAGDIDGAKASCKKCHALYQKKYVSTRRDQPW